MTYGMHGYSCRSRSRAKVEKTVRFFEGLAPYFWYFLFALALLDLQGLAAAFLSSFCSSTAARSSPAAAR